MGFRVLKELLIAGLGNPGLVYARTRHNIGALFVQALCIENQASFKKNSQFNAKVTSFSLASLKIHCLISLDFMNHSGHAIQTFMHYYRFSTRQLLVVQDELDLPPGTFRFKTGGGHAGHNGVRDVIQQLHSNDFHRLRLGIGHPAGSMEVSDYVLSTPTPLESSQLRQSIEDAQLALLHWLKNNFNAENKNGF